MNALSKIYVQSECGLVETPTYRVYSTFTNNYVNYKGKAPIGNILLCNTEVLATQATLQYTVPSNIAILLIPVVGSLAFTTANTPYAIDAGELYHYHSSTNTTYTITNTTSDTIQYVQLWYTLEEAESTLPNSIPIPIIAHPNSWHQPIPSLYITKLNGRKELTLVSENNSYFLYAINGVFEASGCLLHTGDGLYLQHIPLDVEALSEEAILLVWKFNTNYELEA